MIPKSFNEFTVDQFQKWHEITKSCSDPIEREYRLLAMLLGITLEEAEAIPFKELDPFLKQLNQIHIEPINKKVKSIVIINKRVYVAIVNPKQLRELLSTNQFTAAKTYSETTELAIENLDKLLALYYSPFKLFKKPRLADNQAWMAEQFKAAKIKDVYGAVFFYSVVWEKSLPILEPYFNQSMKIIQDHMEEIAREADSLPPTDGIIQ